MFRELKKDYGNPKRRSQGHALIVRDGAPSNHQRFRYNRRDRGGDFRELSHEILMMFSLGRKNGATSHETIGVPTSTRDQR